MEIKKTIKISEDFTDSPGARYRINGDNSGQAFLEDILLPELNKAIESKHKILIDLDDMEGSPSSFVSGSFGKLSLEFGSKTVFDYIVFKSDKNKTRLNKIKREIDNPMKE